MPGIEPDDEEKTYRAELEAIEKAERERSETKPPDQRAAGEKPDPSAPRYYR